MALIYNKTTIPDTGVIKYNGVSLSKIIYNGVTVWTKMTYATSLSGTYGFNVWNQAWEIRTDSTHITFSKNFEKIPTVSVSFTYASIIRSYKVENITTSGFDVSVTHPKSGDPNPYAITMSWTAEV